ncbi:Parathyroid Hormone/Parathyroid Hormone-Related Peptide Receptor [Manis pentadactyla]|nr:Parathyroid Hormone/Parathyroid Hormone-Related Peptide Receptor [Manis pentadactyla]
MGRQPQMLQNQGKEALGWDQALPAPSHCLQPTALWQHLLEKGGRCPGKPTVRDMVLHQGRKAAPSYPLSPLMSGGSKADQHVQLTGEGHGQLEDLQTRPEGMGFFAARCLGWSRQPSAPGPLTPPRVLGDGSLRSAQGFPEAGRGGAKCGHSCHGDATWATWPSSGAAGVILNITKQAENKCDFPLSILSMSCPRGIDLIMKFILKCKQLTKKQTSWLLCEQLGVMGDFQPRTPVKRLSKGILFTPFFRKPGREPSYEHIRRLNV